MASKKNPRRGRTPPLCGEFGPEDGIDPRTYFDESFDPKEDHKVRRLCGQAARALRLVFPDSLGDEVFRELAIIGVEPAPDPSRLVVTVGPARPGVVVDAALVMEALRRVAGFLRSEVAVALNRKRAPTLIFRVAGSEEGTP
jgi:ribosome-binding factor A